jgi:hypothetical protein
MTPPQACPPRLGLLVGLAPAAINQKRSSRADVTKNPYFRLTPVSNECLNFYRQFGKFAASQSLGEWKCVTP